VGHESGQPRITWLVYFVTSSGTRKLLISTSVTASKRIGRSSYLKGIISARVISVRHPDNARTAIQNIKKMLSSPEPGGGLRVFLVHQTTNPYTSL